MRSDPVAPRHVACVVGAGLVRRIAIVEKLIGRSVSGAPRS